MATWHQKRNRAPLWHPEHWTLVSDPPNGMTTSARFLTEAEARERMAQWQSHGQRHLFILPPGGITGGVAQ